jgi:hypothetical protein
MNLKPNNRNREIGLSLNQKAVPLQVRLFGLFGGGDWI